MDGRKPLALLDDLGGRRDRPGPDEQVDVVRLHGQFQDRPALLLALALDQLAAFLGHVADKDRLASFRAPDEVVDDQMDPMLVALVLHNLVVDNDTDIDKVSSTAKAGNRLTTAVETAWLAKRRGLAMIQANPSPSAWQAIRSAAPRMAPRARWAATTVPSGKNGAAGLVLAWTKRGKLGRSS